MIQPRILSFNFHEPYLCLMAKTGLRMDIGHYDQGMLARQWQHQYRAVPPNLNLIDEKTWREGVAQRRYDLIIAHNEMNALDVAKAPCAKILVCHNRRTFLQTAMTVDEGDPIDALDRLLQTLATAFQFVSISPSKGADYAISSRVILPGIDVEEYGGYTGKNKLVLRVGNMMRERKLMFDTDLQEELCRDLPTRILGVNPTLPESAPAASFEDLQQAYRNARCMLHVSRQEFEDGYNLAMLEAMATGMPVVALANHSSPLTPGVDGFTSYDPKRLREYLEALLEDPDLARTIGAKGRERVAKKFPIEAFVEKWRNLIFESVDAYAKHQFPLATADEAQAPKRPKILLHYLSSPLTTAQYIEHALEEGSHVLSAGFRIPEEVLRLWGFQDAPPPYPPQRLALEHKASYQELLEKIPQGYQPDCYFWVDSGPKEVEPDMHHLDMPKIAYLIDTHVSPELRLEMARPFDYVFLAQKGQLDRFKEAGIKNVFWLPLACSPELHDTPPLERSIDVACIGSFSQEEGDRRHKLLATVAQRFPNHVIGKQWPRAMAHTYAQAKIVVNACHNRDVNMRVFEAMASGALLITDEAEGLEDLFEAGKDLVIYHDEAELIRLIAYYLDHETERAQIAARGQALVLEKHSYANRMETLFAQVPVLSKFTYTSKQREQKRLEEYYSHPRREVIQHIPRFAKRILDVGCGAGVLGYTLKNERDIEEVCGVEMVEAAYERAREVLDRVVLGSIEEVDLPFEEDYFDCIVCADVLEHLVDPAAALRKLARHLNPQGLIIVSIPNVRFHEVVAMLSSGGWTYMDMGILDTTHLRFFTRSTLINLVESADLELAAIHPLNARPPYFLPRNEDGSLSLHKVHLRDVDDQEHEEFLVYQWMVCACKPGLDRLAPAREALENHEDALAFTRAADAIGAEEGERYAIMAKAVARMGQLDKAKDFYESAIKIREEAETLAEYGILLVGMDKTREALAPLEKALAQDPQHSRAQGALALVYLQEGKTQAAYETFRTALRSSFDTVALIKPFIQAAQVLDRSQEAIALVESFVEFYPGNIELCCDYADLLIACGEGEKARNRLETAQLFAPDNQRIQALFEQLKS